jgi:hypothetical protein
MIPAEGEPKGMEHRIERNKFDGLVVSLQTQLRPTCASL